MASILDQLDRLGDEHPHKLLYSYLDLNGNPIESYTYASFLQRTKAIAGHLLKEGRFAAEDRLLLAYPPGLEMICAFFGCVRAGLIPVPVYPPSSRGFQSALYKMVHIAKDCQAAGILTSKDYHASLKTNLTRSGVSASGVDVDYISGLPWIVTEDFVDTISDEPFDAFYRHFEDSVSPVHVGVDDGAQGRDGDARKHPGDLSARDRPSLAGSRIVASAVSRYGTDRVLSLSRAAEAARPTASLPRTSFSARSCGSTRSQTYRATATAAPNFAYDYCLRAGRLSKESLEGCDLSSLRVLMCAAEPVKPDTYTRFLEAFQPYGLKSESFYAAYGLAENTLAVSLGGRNIVSVNKRALALGKARMTTEVSEIDAATQIVSCGTPLPGLDVKIVDPEQHVALKAGHIGEIWIAGSGKCLGYWNNPELTLKQFRARLVDDSPYDDGYLRTGDMGFFHDGELFVCGRIKDMIILRGQNYYPQDIENVVERASGLIRNNCVAAFQIHEDSEPALAIVAEVKNPKALPDARKIAAAVRSYLNVEVALISFIAPRAIPQNQFGQDHAPSRPSKCGWMASLPFSPNFRGRRTPGLARAVLTSSRLSTY